MKQKHSFSLVLGIVVVIAAIWSCMYLLAPKQPTLDQRVRDVGSQLKCPICQGESVADSPSLLAQQMRGVIRQQLQAGKSEQEVIQYFVDRYGEQIVWTPQWQGFSLLAWLVPIGLLLAGAGLLLFTLQNWHTRPPTTGLTTTLDKDDNDLLGEDGLERYRVLLKQELVAEDVLFEHYRVESQPCQSL